MTKKNFIFCIFEKDDEKESAGEKTGENAEQKLTAEINSQEKTFVKHTF